MKIERLAVIFDRTNDSSNKCSMITLRFQIKTLPGMEVKYFTRAAGTVQCEMTNLVL